MANAIDGLKLSFTGEEIRAVLQQRIDAHLRYAERWDAELRRGPEEDKEDDPLLPDQLCENEAERHRWRVEVLTMISEHVQPSASYLLGEADLDFGELLPEKPRSLEQQEYEERTGVAFNLERLTKRMGEFAAMGYREALSAERNS